MWGLRVRALSKTMPRLWAEGVRSIFALLIWIGAGGGDFSNLEWIGSYTLSNVIVADEKICLIPSISEILSQTWYHCIQYSKRHHMSLFSYC